MTGTSLLIVAIIVVFVIAFVITMVLLNASAKKIIDTNSKLVDNQNKLLEQNRSQEDGKADQQKIIGLLEEKVEALMAGCNTGGTEVEAAAG